MSCQDICARWRSFSEPSEIALGEGAPQTVRLKHWQTDELANVLTRVLYDEPQFRYLVPEEDTRLRLLPNFFQSAIRASQENGETYTTQEVEGGAVWVRNGNGASLETIMKSAFESARLHSGLESIRRCLNLGTYLDEIHQRLIRGPHWYLLTLGVDPSKRNENVLETLIEPALARADLEGLPCYLEAFSEKSLLYYRTHGFRIAGGGRIPESGPDFWAMIRTPKR